MDPLNIIDIIKSYQDGLRIGYGALNLTMGRNHYYFERGYNFFLEGLENSNTTLLKSAIEQLNHIDENQDRLFCVACSFLFRAMCYACLYDFDTAYFYLEKLDKIDYDFFTINKDVINEAQRFGRELRPEVEEQEREYKEYLQSLVNSGDEGDGNSEESSVDYWKVMFVVLLVVVVIGCVIGLCLFI